MRVTAERDQRVPSTETTRERASEPRSSSTRLRRAAGAVLVHGLLIALSVAFLFPFYFMTVASFMRTSEIFTIHPRLLPEQWQLDSFRLLFGEVPFARNMLNSLTIAATQTLAIVFFCSMAGFSFAKSRFPGRSGLFVFVLSTMMLPSQLQIIPMYEIMSALHWRNTYFSIVVPGLVGAFGIFLMKQYIDMAVPDELLDAATIDGSSFAGTYWRICLPVIQPAVTVLALLTFVGSWNDFLWPLLMLDQPAAQTVSVALGSLQATSASMDPIFWTSVIAGTTLSTLPLVIIFLFAQRFFVSGIMSGAFKGGSH
jgi:ABC-type glycerol-3-phosphate transport system permease component